MSDDRPVLRSRTLGQVPYQSTWERMQTFTRERDTGTPSEVWLLEHPPVFTLGQAGKAEHLLAPGEIPVVKSDRGGQVTYHGPGQLVMYLLLSLREINLGIRGLVTALETIVIEYLEDGGVSASTRRDAPGVYVDDRKICSLGLRVKRGCTYHGLALNVDMDLEPFSRINPCGYAGLEVTQLRDLGILTDVEHAGTALQQRLAEQLGYRLATNTARAN